MIGNQPSLTGNIAAKTISVIATAGQTLFSVSGGYNINQINVYRNGVRLASGRDYTASNGASVTLLSAATVGDVIDFQIFDDFRVADAIVNAAATQTINGDVVVTGTLSGAAIGIQSAGAVIGAAKTLNFVGAGNTFTVTGDTIDVSIAGGGGGGGLGTAINYSNDTTPTPFSYIDRRVNVTENLLLDTTKAGESDSYIVSVVPNIEIVSGVAVTVGSGKTMIIDVLKIGDL